MILCRSSAAAESYLRAGRKWRGKNGSTACSSSQNFTRFTKYFSPLLAMTIAKAAGMTVHSVLFPASNAGLASDIDGSKLSPPPSTTYSRSVVVFIHGRLEADPASDDLEIPRPAVLYSDFCNSLAASMKRDVLLVDYHEHYGDWRREPRDLGIGPVSSAISEAIRKHFNNHDDPADTAVSTKIRLISFSMGAAIVMKPLESDPMLKTSSSSSSSSVSKNGIEVESVVLVEPVWRCWLPFAVSRAAEARYSPDKKKVEISRVACLALVGTNDVEVRDDSSGAMGGSSNRNIGQRVVQSLQPFLPNLSAIEIEGGNHFGLCSGPPELIDFARDGLALDKSSDYLRQELIDHISEFCGQRSDRGDGGVI